MEAASRRSLSFSNPSGYQLHSFHRFMWKYVAGKFQVFKWTGKNDYVALCEPEFLSFGGGYVLILCIVEYLNLIAIV
jgi:hypothetical protein